MPSCFLFAIMENNILLLTFIFYKYDNKISNIYFHSNVKI